MVVKCQELTPFPHLLQFGPHFFAEGERLERLDISEHVNEMISKGSAIRLDAEKGINAIGV